MFRVIILSFGLIISLCLQNFGQNKNAAVVTAPVNVFVTDMKKETQKGEQVLFIRQKNNSSVFRTIRC